MAPGGLDLKVWIAGILIIVAFFVGMQVASAKWTTAADTQKTATKQVVQKLDEAYETLGMAQAYIQALEKKNPEVYGAVMQDQNPNAQKQLRKLVAAQRVKLPPDLAGYGK